MFRTLSLISLFVVGLAVSGRAQGPATLNGGHFGFKIGPTVTRVAVSGISPNTPKNSFDFHLGFMYRYRMNRFVVQPEVLFAIKGGVFTEARLGGGTNVIRNNFNYVSVPLLLGYIPTEGLTLQAGPEFSYALNGPASNGPAVRNDVGLAVGAHYDFLDILDKFSLHVRYVRGFTNISPSDLSRYQNRTLQVAIVYNFYKKKK